MRPLPLVLPLLLAAVPAAAQSWRAPEPAMPDRPAAIGFASAIALQGDEFFAGRTGLVSGLPAPPSHGGGVVRFRRGADGRWTESDVLVARGATLGDGFGSALAVQGDWLAVGAPQHGATGAVFVFRKVAGKWTEHAMLTPPLGRAGDEFGAAVALEAQRLAIGAPGADSARGAVYSTVRDRRSASWSPVVRVGGGQETYDRLGDAVATWGDRVLAGAPGVMRGGPNPFGGGARPVIRNGTARVFVADRRGSWTEEAVLASAADTAKGYGAAVWLDETEAFVGAPRTARAAGAVYAYKRSGSTWQQVARLQPAVAEPVSGFGWSLVRDGEQLLVGAPMANRTAGRVHVLERSAAGWTERQVLPGVDGARTAQLGARLAANGGHLVAAAPASDNGMGSVVGWTRGPGAEWGTAQLVLDRPPELAAVRGGRKRCEDGRVGGFACRDVDLEAFLPISQIGGKRGTSLNDVWGWTDPQTGREIALVGRSDGTSFLDVTDPANPRYLGDLPLHEGARPNMWRGIRVYKDHAFIVADGAGPHGMQVFDLTQLRGVVEPRTFGETAHYGNLASAHTLALNDESGYAFATGANGGGETCGGALHMVDVRDPAKPAFAGCFADPTTGIQRTGYTHETQCVTYKGPDTRFAGREICFNNSETALGIADVTDKAAPKALSTVSYPNVTYTHQGWLSEDGRYYFVNDEGDEMSNLTGGKTRTLIFDVSKLDEPVLAREFAGTTAAIDHNLYVRGRYMFQSNYTAGVRVIDVADPKNPKEVAYFDTYPEGEDATGFAGTWTNYPFFKSGTILATGIGEGIFVLRHRPQESLP